MAGTMALVDLVADLKASLHDAAEVFDEPADADFVRLLNVAALDFARLRPRTLIGSVTLSAGVAEYAAPVDFHHYKSDLWVDHARIGKPWEKTWTGRLPSVSLAENGAGRCLLFSPAPTVAQIARFGSEFRYLYFARHQLGTEAETSIHAADRGLLMLRGQVEAMRELAMRNITKPMQVRDGLNSSPRNGMPSYLYGVLLEEFNKAAA